MSCRCRTSGSPEHSFVETVKDGNHTSVSCSGAEEDVPTSSESQEALRRPPPWTLTGRKWKSCVNSLAAGHVTLCACHVQKAQKLIDLKENWASTNLSNRYLLVFSAHGNRSLMTVGQT